MPEPFMPGNHPSPARIGSRKAQAFFICLVLAAFGPAKDAGANDSSMLRWDNGDEISGRLVSATSSHLVWRCDALSGDVSLDLSVLDSIHGPETSASNTPSDTFRVQLMNGDELSGELRKITPDYVLLKSTRHGVISIGRKWISRIKRWDYFDSVDLVDRQGRDWMSLDATWNPGDPTDSGLANWETDQPGQVSTTAPGARLYRSTQISNFCHIDLALECATRPAFALAVGSLERLKDRQADLKLATWADELVVQAPTIAGDFEHLMRLRPDTRQIHLRIFWDRVAGKISVYDDQGERLLDAAVDRADALVNGGILLENKGSDLTVKRLRIGNWLGKVPPRVVAGQDRVRTLDGREYYGQISRPSAAGRTVAVASDGNSVEVPLDQIAEIMIHRTSFAVPRTNSCDLIFNDGTRLQGDLQSINNGIATLKSAVSQYPVYARLDGLKSCQFKSTSTTPREVYGATYELEHQGLRHSGSLAAVDSTFGWRPIGASQFIPLQLDTPWHIRRSIPSSQPGKNLPAHHDVVYLRNGDQVPCRVERIDKQTVWLDAEIGQASQIPRVSVKAIEFAAESFGEVTGFGGSHWQITGKQPEAVQRTDQQVVFRDKGKVAHPQLLRSGMFEFDLQGTPDAHIVLSVIPWTDDSGRNLNNQMFYLMHVGNRVMVRAISERTVRQQNVQVNLNTDEPVRLKFHTTRKNLEMSVNDEVVTQLPLPGKKERKPGVVISCQQIRARNRQANANLQLVISNMHADGGSGLLGHRAVSEAARKHVLTLPRRRRRHPPSHVLIAQNGDLLRGALIALGRESIEFRSESDDVKIPRERISGIVWLAGEAGALAEPENRVAPVPSGDVPSMSPTDGQVQATLGSGIRLEFSPITIEDGEIVGKHAILGTCRINLSAVDRLCTGQTETRQSENRRLAFSKWKLVSAREPSMPDTSASPTFGTYSSLVGQQAEDFSLTLLDGGRFQLSDHRDKIVVLDFWTTWCGPCVQGLPQLVGATSQHSPEDVLFVAVNQEETGAAVKQFLKNRGWDFAVALDDDGRVGRKYQLEGYPHTVIVGRGGWIEYVHLGSNPNLERELKDALSELLRKTESEASQFTE